MIDNSFFDKLSDEIKGKLKSCKTEEELKSVLTEAGIELDQAVLEAVSGGAPCHQYSKPICKVYTPPSCPSNSRII